MRILLSNDDGIDSLGLLTLGRRLSEQNEVLIVAPNGNRSGCSHSLSIRKKIKVRKRNDITWATAYETNGTPADCVKFARLALAEFKPDVVIAGINKGHNLGADIFYSGTVSIAIESAFFGIPAFGFSAFSHEDSDFNLYSEYALKIIEKLLPESSSRDVYNVNFPADNFTEIKGVKITKLGTHIYSDRYEVFGDDEYMLVGKPLDLKVTDFDTDVEWLKRGYATVTPLLFDKTNFEKIEKVKNLCEEL